MSPPAFALAGVSLPPELLGIDLAVASGACATLSAERPACEAIADVIGGLVAPQAGMAAALGQEWQALSATATYALRARVGRIGHQPAWLQNLNVDENVLLPLLDQTRTSLPDLRQRAHALALALGLDEVPRSRPARTARGELAAAAAVRALLGDPAVLLIEPLDAAWPDAAREALRRLVSDACARGAAALWMLAPHEPIPALPDGPRLKLAQGRLVPQPTPHAP